MTENKKDKILATAKVFFLANGFSGTSIAQIAKAAGVAKSLIFHHFPSKEALWQAVKAEYLSHMSVSELAPIPSDCSLPEFIEQYVSRRFKAYAANPNLAKLIAWQQLEPASDALAGVGEYRPDALEENIITLQKMGKMDPKLDPSFVSIMIYGAVSQVFFDHQRQIYLNTEQLNAYKNFVIHALVNALSSK